MSNIVDVGLAFDKETDYRNNSPLKGGLSEDYVNGFVEGLKHGKFLYESAALPIPNLDKILEKYDGLIITGERGSGKTRTALQVINYIMESRYAPQSSIFIFPKMIVAQEALKSAEHTGLLSGKYVETYNRLCWRQGMAIAHIVSSENPMRMRGLQSGVLWLEEIESFAKPENNMAKELYENINDYPTPIVDLALMSHRLNYRKVIITGTEARQAIKDTWLQRLALYTYHVNKEI